MTTPTRTTAIAAAATVVASVVVVSALRSTPKHLAGTTAVRPGQPQVQAPQNVAPVVSKGPTIGPRFAVTREAQSRLWFTAGTWWALLSDSNGAQRIFELGADHSWRDTGVIVDSRARSTGDTLWDGKNLVVASRTSNGSIEISRLTFNTTTRQWSVDAGFPVKIANDGTVVTTITRDATGRLWIVYVSGAQVWYATTNGNDAAWTAPAHLPPATTPVKDEDIATVVAYPGHVGVLWSDQVSGAFHFATHADGAPVSTWSTEAIPLKGPLAADNHVSIKVAQNGQILAAVKTSFGDQPGRANAAQVVLLSRSTAGQWTAVGVASVSSSATRGITMIDDERQLVYVILTAPEPGGAVYMKAASLSRLVFDTGRGQRVLAAKDATIGSATASKQNVSSATGIVILGADEKTGTYYRADIVLRPFTTTTTT